LKVIIYDKPQLVLLDADSNYGYGSCTIGGNFRCKTGTSFDSGGETCTPTGNYANVTCTGTGLKAGGNLCKPGAVAMSKCNTGTDIG
jgi:hypothetical protein